MVDSWNWGIAPAIAMGLVASLGSGVLLAPMMKLKGPYYAISSLVMMFVFQTLIVNLPSWAAKNVTDISLVRIYDSTLTYFLTLAGTVVTIFIIYYIKTSRFGLAFQAIKDDEPVAAMAGVRVNLYKVLVSILTAVLAGYAGIMYAWYTSFLYPEAIFDINIPTLAIVMALFGGLRTVMGPVIASTILYSLLVYLSGLFGGAYVLLYLPVFSIFLIVIVLFLPQGLMNSLYRRSPLVGRLLK